MLVPLLIDALTRIMNAYYSKKVTTPVRATSRLLWLAVLIRWRTAH
jgi:hypothetical protein